MKTPRDIKNKHKREDVYHKQKAERNREKHEERKRRKKLEDANPELREERLKKNIPRTIENAKEYQEAIVGDDEEVFADEDTDEFASYFLEGRAPKMCVTTNMRPSKDLHQFAKEFARMFPTAEVRKRGGFEIKEIISYCKERDYTDLIVLHEDKKQDGPNAAIFIHLPDGPTAYFKLSNIKLSHEINGGPKVSPHHPEIILNNFNTRLGHTIGRYFATMFPPVPEFEGRQVVTFHNQRDFIFVRRHRYVFENKEKVKLQELGPKFTMKLRWLQKGTFDTKYGDYEWSFAQKMETSRRKFFL
ncbi:Ribosome production factor 1 [Blastocladiella emersonii ATCC 22665]|nr:Ribosome production factor 1 [Blastocladiella emersonii ATCC 22665]